MVPYPLSLSVCRFYAYGEIGPEAMHREDCTPSTSLQCTQTGNVARQVQS